MLTKKQNGVPHGLVPTHTALNFLSSECLWETACENHRSWNVIIT